MIVVIYSINPCISLSLKLTILCTDILSGLKPHCKHFNIIVSDQALGVKVFK